MTPEQANTHERAIRDQFSRQAAGFAVAPELHADGIVALVVEAAKPQAVDRAIDLACGPGTVACALAQRPMCAYNGRSVRGRHLRDIADVRKRWLRPAAV